MIDPVKAHQLYVQAEQIQASVGLKPVQLSTLMLALMLSDGLDPAAAVPSLRASVIVLKAALGGQRAEAVDPTAAVYGMQLPPKDIAEAQTVSNDDAVEAALALVQEQLAPLVARLEALEAAQAGRKPKKTAEPTLDAADQG